MSFTYSDLLTTDFERVRFEIGDTEPNNGPRPMRKNFTDSQISYFLSAEDGRLNGAIARAFEVLAGEWGSYAQSESNGDKRRDASNVAAAHRASAKTAREKADGETTRSAATGSVMPTRVDGYSD